MISLIASSQYELGDNTLSKYFEVLVKWIVNNASFITWKKMYSHSRVEVADERELQKV